MDWLVDVHLKYKLLPETLFICVNLIDRYSAKSLIKRKDYQLVGVTCMLIAAKYEEIYPPYVDNFVYITDHAYRREQIIDKEREILEELQFDITFVTQFRLLQRYAKIARSSEAAFMVAQYTLELSLVEVAMNRWRPDVLACSAIYIGNKILKQSDPWLPLLVAQAGLSPSEIRNCARE